MMKKTLLFLIALISIFIGCQVDKAGFPQITNNTTLDGTWFLKTEIINGFSGTTAATPDTIMGFTVNDFYKFNTDNTVTYSNSTTNVVSSGYYSLLTNAGIQTLTIGTAAGGPGNAYTINKLSTDSLILYNTVTTTSAGVSSTTYTTHYYTH